MKKQNYDVCIVGGGVVGTSIAYYLAKSGVTNVIVLERNYLASGSTGRCGGGIRQQWSTEMNCRLAIESVRMFEQLEKELDYDIEYHQGGYLILAFEEKELEQFKKNIKLQQGLGLECFLLNPQEAKEIVPLLDVSEVKGATFCPTDGHANPFRVTYAYARAAQRLGVTIKTGCEVKDLTVNQGRVTRILTSAGEISAGYLVNAAGGWSGEIARMAGIEIPVKSYRHEILVTEPLEHFLDPMIISFDYNIYFRQEKNGGILMGHGDPAEPESFNQRASLEFLQAISRKAVKLMPALKNINILRQWAGLYNVTPDAQPILGGVDSLENYYQAVGFSGHGFMLAPRVASLIAELIISGQTSFPIQSLHLNRFKHGTHALRKEGSVV